MSFYWIATNKPAVMLLIFALGIINQFIYYRHLRKGLFKEADLGYFWRLWQKGDRDGKIMIYTTFIALALTALLIVSMWKAL